MREVFVQEGTPRHIALLEDGVLTEYLIDGADEAAGTIILGCVERIVPGLDAAFVDIGREKNGFLPLKEKSKTFTGQKLAAGDRVPVQIRREEHGSKGAFLSRDITLAGELAILMPMNRFVGVSARLEEKRADTLRAFGRDLTDGAFGVVFRTAAGDAGEQEIAAEIAALTERWAGIAEQLRTAHAPCVLEEGGDALSRIRRDYASVGIDRETIGPDAFAGTDIPAQRDRALKRTVYLKSGGSLVIDICEAMTVIDVNTAAFTGKKQGGSTARLLNIEAAGEIVHQLRLRNLSGIIIIDFIDMDSDDDRRAVREAMEEALKNDRQKTVVHGFTSLGLLEMTRKRAGRTLKDVLNGSGELE